MNPPPLIRLLCLGVLPALLRAGETPEDFTIPAWAFHRGNAKIFTEQYAEGGPMVAFGASSPVKLEYTLELPLEAEYTLSFRYAAQQARPVRVSVDDRDLGEGCRSASG